MLFRGGIDSIIDLSSRSSFPRKKEYIMKHSRFIAVLLVSVMLFGRLRPAFAGWSGNKEVGKQAEKFGEVGKTVNTVYQVYKTGSDLYNAKNNDERIDIVIDVAKEAGKNLVKAPIKAAASAVVGGAIVAGAAWGVCRLIDWIW